MQLAISKLDKLLREMSPRLAEGEYFMACVPESKMMSLLGCLDSIMCVYREEEGLSIVFSAEMGEKMGGLSGGDVAGPFALISLEVNSDLFAVGFLAKVTEALANAGISVNAFSAYYHDHLLVPYGKREEAMAALGELSAKN